MHLDIRYHTHCTAPAFPAFSLSCFSLPEANSLYLEYSAGASFNSWNWRKVPYFCYTYWILGHLKTFTVICFCTKVSTCSLCSSKKMNSLFQPCCLPQGIQHSLKWCAMKICIQHSNNHNELKKKTIFTIISQASSSLVLR